MASHSGAAEGADAEGQTAAALAVVDAVGGSSERRRRRVQALLSVLHNVVVVREAPRIT